MWTEGRIQNTFKNVGSLRSTMFVFVIVASTVGTFLYYVCVCLPTCNVMACGCLSIVYLLKLAHSFPDCISSRRRVFVVRYEFT
jgi:hypothetical protein